MTKNKDFVKIDGLIIYTSEGKYREIIDMEELDKLSVKTTVGCRGNYITECSKKITLKEVYEIVNCQSKWIYDKGIEKKVYIPLNKK